MIRRARNVLVTVCLTVVASSCASLGTSADRASVLGTTVTPASDQTVASASDGNGYGRSDGAERGAERTNSVFDTDARIGDTHDERPAITVRTGDTLEDIANAPERPAPRSITIPELDIIAPILAAGIDDRGEFDLPPGDEAGWYRFGPTPGEQGSAVIAAHVDWNGVPGAFFELRDAKPGQEVVVDFANNTSAVFRVVEVRQYDKTALPLHELFERSGDPRLTLITCGGDFDPATRSYDDNVVVVAEPI